MPDDPQNDAHAGNGPDCPACGAATPLRIVYGLIDPRRMAEAIEREKFAVGGCIIAPDCPSWKCRVCAERYGSLNDARTGEV